MKIRKAIIGFLLITLFYVGLLIWVDSKNQVFGQLHQIIRDLPILMGFSFTSYIFRYIRWHWLLSRGGNSIGWFWGFLSYISGFAFTATPGKVGELIRIRSLIKVGVQPSRVIAAFIFERGFDLIVVLGLAALAVDRRDIFFVSLIFVGLFLGALVVVAFHPHLLTKISQYLLARKCIKLSHVTSMLRDGLFACRIWMNFKDISVSLILGLCAWICTSCSFVWFIGTLGVGIPTLQAFTVYPLSMLAGAASMLPGGVGSTELTIIVLLTWHGAAVGVATLSAIGFRFATIWFAVIAGFIALGILEMKQYLSRN